MNVAESPNVIELCAGVAGLGLGVRLAIPGARTVCYVENEITAAEKLDARMEDGALDSAPIYTNLKTFDGRAWRGIVDILLAGYPCQPFSCAGKRKGARDPRHLWPHVARIIRECEPAVVFLENVANHLKLGFYEVARELRRMGYRVTAGIFTAEEIGAPHLRKRLFVLAYRDGQHGATREEFHAIGRTHETARFNNRGAELAVGAIGRRGIVRESPRRDGLIDGRGAELADGESTHRRRELETGTAAAGGRRNGRRGYPGSGKELADGAGARLQKRLGIIGDAVKERAAAQRSGGRFLRPLFPPRPDELERWADVLRHDRTLKPAVRGMVDGISSRVDRLRATGNGVFPLVAAYAFATLAEAYRDAA